MTEQKAEKPMTQLQPNRFTAAEFVRNVYRIVPEHGTPFEALLESSYWAHVAAKLRPLDEIVVHAEDGSYYGRLLVRDAGRLYAKVFKLEHYELDEVEVQQGGPPMPEGYGIKWRGPQLKWCVLRGKDVLKDSMEKAVAQAWLTEHLKTVGT